MTTELLDLYDRVGAWASGVVPEASKRLDAATPCDKWDVRTLLNHVIDTQQYFVDSARGNDATPPGPNPPDRIGDDPVGAFESVRQATASTFAQPGVVDK